MNINPLTAFTSPSCVSKIVTSMEGHLFSSSFNNTVRLWECGSPRRVVKMSTKINDFSLFPGRANTLVCINDRAIQLWDIVESKLIKGGAAKHDLSRVISPSKGDWIALSGNRHFSVLTSALKPSVFCETTSPISAFNFHLDHTLLVGSDRGGFSTFDCIAGKLNGIFQSEIELRNFISLNENLVACSSLRSLHFWDLREANKPLNVDPVPRIQTIFSLIPLINQKNNFVLGQGSHIELWDLRTRALSCSWKAHDKAVLTLAEGSRSIFSGGPDNELKQWDTRLLGGEREVAVVARAAERVAECPSIDFALLKLGRELGKGSFGVVYAAEWHKEPVAVKQLHRITDEARRDFMKEATLLAALRHPRVVQLFGTSEHSPGSLSIVLEFMENGSLYSHLHSSQKPDLPKRKIIARDITSGLVYLHRRTPQVLHRDLKSPNVLLDGEFRAKLSDLGLFGTLRWMAPELFRGEKTSAASDVYSLAITLWELFESEKPFRNVENKIVMEQVKSGLRPAFHDTPPLLRPIIERSWRQIPQERLTADQLLDTLSEALQ